MERSNYLRQFRDVHVLSSERSRTRPYAQASHQPGGYKILRQVNCHFTSKMNRACSPPIIQAAAHQRVECGNHLRQLSDIHAPCDVRPKAKPKAQEPKKLRGNCR
jgi:hypothetical protein